MVNLFSNAAKFVAPGVDPRIVVRTEARGARVRVWVEDNGIGIRREDEERIFLMFERLNVASLYPGTGIGLAIARRAVERMGGTMGVESTPGEGSRFGPSSLRRRGSVNVDRRLDAGRGRARDRRPRAEEARIVLGLATGGSPAGVYRGSAASAEEDVDFREVETFPLDEYVDLRPATAAVRGGRASACLSPPDPARERARPARRRITSAIRDVGD
jgi:hypothetical protein